MQSGCDDDPAVRIILDNCKKTPAVS